MSTSTPLPEGVALNPRVLQWARQESGWAPEDLADKLKVKRERFAAWESGERAPTLRQVENVARQLHRPLSLFFLPKPPSLLDHSPSDGDPPAFLWANV